jgi:hypothetical protein
MSNCRIRLVAFRLRVSLKSLESILPRLTRPY